jgi:hypothetical protein
MKQWLPQVDISPAKRFGEVNIMLPPEANRLHAAPIAQVLREKMVDYSDRDCFVALGDPTIIAMAACIAHQKARGLLRILKWDRNTSDYIMVEVRV